MRILHSRTFYSHRYRKEEGELDPNGYYNRNVYLSRFIINKISFPLSPHMVYTVGLDVSRPPLRITSELSFRRLHHLILYII